MLAGDFRYSFHYLISGIVGELCALDEVERQSVIARGQTDRSQYVL